MEPVSDPLARPLLELARQAQALGYAPPGDLRAIVDETVLQESARR
jgi:hypothetical protein